MRSWMVPVLLHGVLVQALITAFRPGTAYAMIEAGAGTTALGMLAMSAALPALALALPTGRFVDRVGERWSVLAGSLVVVAGVTIGLAGIASTTMLLIANAVVGCGFMACMVAQQAAVANQAASTRMDAAFGAYTVATSAGQLIGPLLLALPGRSPSYPPVELVLACCLAFAVAAVIGSFFVPSAVSRPFASLPSNGMLTDARDLVRGSGVVRALIVGSLSVGVVEVVVVFWPAVGVGVGVGAIVVSAMLVLRAFASIASRLLVGVAVRLWGRSGVLVLAIVAGSIGLAMTAVPNVPTMIAGAIVFGFGVGACQPLCMAWLVAITPSSNRGLTTSLRLVGNRIAQATIPLGLGALAVLIGVPGMVAGFGVVFALTAFLVGRPGSDRGA